MPINIKTIFFQKLLPNYIFRIFTIFTVYVILGHYCLLLPQFMGMDIELSPAAGVAVGAILIWGYAILPAVFLGSITVYLSHYNSVMPYMGTHIANVIEPAVVAYLCMHANEFHRSLDRLQDVVRMVSAITFGGLMRAIIISPSLFLGVYRNTDYIIFIQHWIGDIIGVLTVAPIILVFSSPSPLDTLNWKNFTFQEKIILGVTLVSGMLLFSKFTGPIRLYFFFPLIFWVALRLGQRGVVLVSMILSISVVYLSSVGMGPFVSPEAEADSVFYLIVFLLALKSTGLFVAGALTEQEMEKINKENALQNSNTQLEKSIQDLKTAKEAAESSSAAKTAFLANVSHEIRTPLGAVLGFSDLVLANNMSEAERKRVCEIIKRNGLQLLNVINDILDLSKVEAGKFELQKRAVSMSEILEDISVTMQSEAEKKGISFKLSSELNVPKKIYTDPLRLRQILNNIVGNAIKFTDRGSVDLKIKTIIDKNGNNKVAFVITDTGIGIPSDKVKDLFSPFTQVDVASNRRFGGTGLGLALSQRLAMTLGGGIEVAKTTLGQGSEFVITIDPGDSVQILKSEKKMQAESADTLKKIIKSEYLKNKKILLAEDNLDNQSLFTYYIRSVNAKVEVANNGSEAVQKIHNGQFDIVLMDLQMPEMDGYEATKVLRSEGYKKPIIALSAHAMKEVREKCLASGFDGYISKPVERQELIRVLAEFSKNPVKKEIQAQTELQSQL